MYFLAFIAYVKSLSNISPWRIQCFEICVSGEGGGDGPALAGGSVEGGSPCFGGGEGGSTPPVIRWSYSLPQLLEDSQGVQLFQEFLKEECGSCESLHFWFACNGLRKSTQDPSQLVTIIWKRFIRNFVVRVSEKTYKIVNDRINARSIDRNIFDDAQREVSAWLKELFGTLVGVMVVSSLLFTDILFLIV